MLDPLYITRKEIVQLSGASKSQVYKVTADPSSGFPKVATHAGWRNEALWRKEEVDAFLKKHTWTTLQTRRTRKPAKPLASTGTDSLNMVFKRARRRVRQSKYTSEVLALTALGFSSRSAFAKFNWAAYRASLRRGKDFLDSICQHMQRPKQYK